MIWLIYFKFPQNVFTSRDLQNVSSYKRWLTFWVGQSSFVFCCFEMSQGYFKVLSLILLHICSIVGHPHPVSWFPQYPPVVNPYFCPTFPFCAYSIGSPYPYFIPHLPIYGYNIEQIHLTNPEPMHKEGNYKSRHNLQIGKDLAS